MSGSNADDVTESEKSETDPSLPPKNRDQSESVDTVFAVLADRDRRAIVSYFVERNTETATVTELTNHCQQESMSKTGQGTTERVTSQLHHQHLPRLADTGVIEYDARSETIRYRGDPLLESLLEYVQSLEL